MAVHVYISHAIGELDDVGADQRRENVKNAELWVRFFIDATRWVIQCPWYLYAITHGEAIYGPRRLMDQLATLERCDLLVQCGGVMSPHMYYEEKFAKRHGIPIIDLTSFGIMPPELDEDITQVMLARVRRVVIAKPRRVWLPSLTNDDLRHLIAIRHLIATHVPGEHMIAIALLDRILFAAHETIDDDGGGSNEGPQR